MINIVIADDHSVVREGLKRWISKEAIDMEVTGEASSAAELMNVLSNSEPLPDIVLLDITMPDKNGLDILKEIKRFYPKVRVLILSMHPEERYAVRALRAGASGYFCKESNLSKNLVQAIRVIVIQKQRYISVDVANQLAQRMDATDLFKDYETLSDREYEVLRMIASGKKIRAIAEKMSITIQTVHTYRNRIKEKLDLKTDTELTKYAVEHGLVD